MSFYLLCMIAVATTLPFGLAFLLMPDLTASFYGIAGWNPGTTAIARLFGIELLYVAGMSFAVMGATDLRLQRRFALAATLVSAIATVLTIQTILSGAVGPLHWSTAALYLFFTVAWGMFAMRSKAAHT